MLLFYIAIGYFGLMSIVTFALYVADKNKAKQGAWRIPERVLLLMSFFGGAIGGFGAMLLVRHKTRAEHWYFTVVNLLGIAWQVAAVVLLLIYKPLADVLG